MTQDDQDRTTAGGRQADAVTSAVTRRSAWLWSWAVVAVGVVIEVVNRPGQLTETYLMLAVVAACLVLVWATLRRRDVLGTPVETVLLVALPAAFLFSVAGIDYGRQDVLYYQAIGITPLTTMLLVHGRRTVWRAALGVLAATAVVTAVVLGTTSIDRAAVALVAVAPALGIAIGWRLFRDLVGDLVGRAEDNRELAFGSALESAARREVMQSRRRWSTAGLERSAVLLRGIGEGRLALDDRVVQDWCGQEERYLRQVLLLSPAAYRAARWFGQALDVARANGTALVVRSGDDDAPDDASAEELGELLLECVTEAGAGASLVVSFFGGAAGPRLVVVAPLHALRGSTRARPLDAWAVDITVLDEREVLEARLASQP